MLLSRRYYKNRDIHLYSYDVGEDSLTLTIINKKEITIDSVSFLFCEHEYKCDINSNQMVISFSIPFKGFYNYEPMILSYVCEGKEIIFDKLEEAEYIVSSKSVNYLNKEKYAYINKMNKENGIPKKKITCFAEKHQHYWYCICGTLNLNEQCECMKCGNKQDVIFSHEIQYNEKKTDTDVEIENNTFILSLLIIIALVNLFVTGVFYKGDILFGSEIQATPFHVFNRIMYFALPLSTIGMTYGLKKYKRILANVFYYLRYAVLIYLNLVSCISFVKSSYIFALIMMLDASFIVYEIFRIIKKNEKKTKYVSLVLSTSFVVCLLSQMFVYKKYDMKITAKGITLTCNVNEEEYVVPEKINGNKVTKLVFDPKYDYSKIKRIKLAKNIEEISAGLSYYFPSLESIAVDSGNEYFEAYDDILFIKGTKNVVLCPAQKKEVTIDWERVYGKDFYGVIGLEKVNFTENVKYIEAEAFEYCVSLNEINFQGDSNIYSIGELAFKGCTDLKKVVIPNSLQTMGRAIFYGCYGMEEITLPFIGEYRYQKEAITNQTHSLYPFGYGYNWSVEGYENHILKKMVITEQTYIQGKAFYQCPCEYIEINETLLSKKFDKECFRFCKNLKEIKIPYNIEVIDEECFESDENLHYVSLNNNLKSIGKRAFGGCSNVTNVNFHGNVSELQISDEGNQKIIELLGKN